MDSSSFLQAPTQVTCAYCQRTRSRPQRLPRHHCNLSLQRAAHYRAISRSVNTSPTGPSYHHLDRPAQTAEPSPPKRAAHYAGLRTSVKHFVQSRRPTPPPASPAEPVPQKRGANYGCARCVCEAVVTTFLKAGPNGCAMPIVAGLGRIAISRPAAEPGQSCACQPAASPRNRAETAAADLPPPHHRP